MSVVENIVKACEGLGSVELNGIKLETADPNLLDVSFMDLDQHVAMQPAAIAYFGMLRKEASRMLANCQRAYDRWQKKKYVDAKAVVDSKAKNTASVKVEEIKAQVLIDNEPEVEKWEARIDRLQKECDTLDEWYEAWRQKSFTIREHARIDEDERFNSNSSVGGGNGHSGREDFRPPLRSRTENVRRIMKERQAAKAAEQGKE
jgi:hypothetical protein